MRNTLKIERRKKNLTQVHLAELVAVSRQTIISIESGRYIPSVLLALKIAKVLKVHAEDLFEVEKTD